MAGASGFAGAKLTRELVQQGHKVYALVRDPNKLHSVLGGDYTERVSVLRGDLLDQSDLENLKKRLAKLADNLDVVVQTVGGGPLTSNRSLAATISDLNYKTTSNLMGMLEGSSKLSSIRLLVYFSSLAAMGMPESKGGSINYNETSPCNPVLPYEQAKFETEAFLKNFASTHKLKTVVLRFPQIYGGPDDAFMQMVGLIRKRAFPLVRGKIGSLPLIHVRDVVGATCAVIRNAERIPESCAVYLVSEGSYSYSRMVTVIQKNYGHGSAVQLPYVLMYLGISMVEGLFGLLGKPEPLNRRRLLSLTKDRIVDSTKFVSAFNFKFEENVERFVAQELT
ncbi:MAG TPA: NAD(P)-dependent oxidoreductase [Candidatus Acidoferrum sp.]|nr:NAD(P)-dependent oxidoreductase [Candidatus Acidoferrum sp.]